ncbi:MAG TPA: fimbria/pilus outer membrane usher protein, partial [Burkholderiaceae bacterium]|nr:fimbria/pilus outer membrane usher protein [Burkholderiaceae bacterium]
DNYGVASNEYGRFVAVGTHRLGFTDHLTGEAHGEFLRDQQSVGLSAALLWPAAGVLSSSIAGSRSKGGDGSLLALGFERQSRWLSFGGSAQLATERFTQLGLQPGQPAPRQLGQAFISMATGGYGSFGLNYAHQNYRDRDEVKLVSASYSTTLGKLGFLSLSVLRSLGADAKTAVGLIFTRSLGENTSASASATRQADSRQAQLQIQRNLPAGSGVGYRLLAGTGDAERREAGVSLQNDVGTYGLETARFQGQTSYRGNASGGIAMLRGDTFLSRRIDDSFAVVKVPDYPNVRVYADNQIVARTGADGSALLPRLRPYQKNSVRIEQADLPLDAQIDSMQLDAVPYFRSGALLQFPVRRSRGALMTIILEHGEPLPAGALVRIAGQAEEFPTGLRGEVYLTGLEANNRLRINWRGQSCDIVVSFPATTEPLPHLGTHACIGVKP